MDGGAVVLNMDTPPAGKYGLLAMKRWMEKRIG